MYPNYYDSKPSLIDQTNTPYRNNGYGQPTPMVQPPHLSTGGYPYPLRRGLAPFQQQGYNPFLSGHPMSPPPNAPWGPHRSNGFGTAPFGFNSPRPTGGLFGMGASRPGFGSRPKLDPDAIREFLTQGIGRINSLMSGIDRVSQTVQQISPIIQMFQGLNSANTSASAPASTNLNSTDTGSGTSPRKKRSPAKRSKGSVGKKSR
jgi:hypothetical protein